ncbi:SPC98 [Candida theae]|uniref:Spindle pole body component n=1 Tax=Candida theae TaxID=1198502 RepID=A0AAD5FX25_9ASCO|nr:SPC98 [Candida theae]KAI5952145.1 SPC98 [Candida theae]
MVLDKPQVVRLYVHRVAKSLIPAELGEEYIQSVANELYTSLINTQGVHNDISTIINKYKSVFLNSGSKQEWNEFQALVTSLSQHRSLDQIANYLTFLDALREDSDIQSSAGGELSIESPRINTNDKTLAQLIQPYYKTLPEETILTYLPYTLMGLDSKLFTFSNDYKRIEIPPSINNSYGSFLKLLFEYALLYKQLDMFVDENRGKLPSAIKGAFVAVVDKELKKYSQDLNKVFSNQPTTILTVYHAIHEWIFPFRFLYRAALQMAKLDGYHFLNLIYKFTKFGDENILSIAKFTFSEIVKPYYNVLEFWITKGELVDRNNEFFISFEDDGESFNQIIQYHGDKVPEFIESSDKIFQIGKTLIFLEKYCQELKFVDEFNVKYSTTIFTYHNGLASMTINEIIELIDQQYDEVLAFFTKLIHEKYHLFTHLLNFKNYYLMEINEFIEAIIIKGEAAFNLPSLEITSSQLHQILHDAMQISSVKTRNNVSRIDSKIFNPQLETFGWDSFLIDYKISDLPIFDILESSMVKYLKAFHFFWKLRHLQVLLQSNYLAFDQLNLKIGPRVRNSFRRLVTNVNGVNIMRHHLIKFLDDLVAYLSYDIVENSFDTMIIDKLFHRKGNELVLDKSFMKLPERATATMPLNVNKLTIDELISVHDEYLDNIVYTKLFNGSVKGAKTNISFIDQIYEILQSIFRFINTSQEYLSVMETFLVLVNSRESAGHAEVDQEQEYQLEKDIDEVSNRSTKLWRKLKVEIFNGEFQSLVDGLKQDLKLDNDLKEFGKMFVVK